MCIPNIFYLLLTNRKHLLILIFQILSLMVGANKSSEQLIAIADRTMLEADEDKDGYINFEEFKKVSIWNLITRHVHTGFVAYMHVELLDYCICKLCEKYF